MAVCGNVVRSSGASDITLTAGSKIKTREDEEGARYCDRCREVLVGQFFVWLSLMEIGNTGFFHWLFVRVLLMVFMIFDILEHV